MSIGNLIDQLYQLRQDRLKVEKEVAAMKSQETELRARIMEELDDVGLAKATGAVATAGIIQSIQPYVEDWEQVHAYVRANNRFDLLQKRLSAPAWRSLIEEDGQLVPGTLVTEVRDISLTKASRS